MGARTDQYSSPGLRGGPLTRLVLAPSGRREPSPGSRCPVPRGRTGLDLSQVYREHYRSLVRFLYRRTGDQGKAEDLAQEAFVRAIEHHAQSERSIGLKVRCRGFQIFAPSYCRDGLRCCC